MSVSTGSLGLSLAGNVRMQQMLPNRILSLPNFTTIGRVDLGRL